MFDTGLHITTMLNTSWLPWLCLAMVGLVWVSCVLQPRYLPSLLSNSFADFDINDSEQVPSIGSQITQWLFNSIVPAICIFTLVTQGAVYGTELFGQILLLSLLTDAFRAVAVLMESYTFRFGKLTYKAYLRYYSLRSLFTFFELALVLLLAHTTPQLPWLMILGLLTIVYLVMLGLQWARLFCKSVWDIFGLIIHLITVELLPTALLFEVGKQLYL